MNPLFVLALTLLLLPVPLSFLIPAAPQASPDPWRVRRARRAVIGFALVVAIVQLVSLAFRIRLWEGIDWEPPRSVVADYGLFGWAAMSWFFLSMLILELRRAKPDPFPGQHQRSASLRPRGAGDVIAERTWWILRGVWLATAAFLLVSVPDRVSSSIVLLLAGFILAMAPRIVRQSSLSAEPLLPEGSEKLLQAYTRRRRLRARIVVASCMVGVVSQTLLAAALGWDVAIDLTFIMLGATIAVLALLILVYLVRDRAASRQIGHLQELAAGSSANAVNPQSSNGRGA